MQIRSYEESIKVTILKSTPDPGKLVKGAADLTQTKNLAFETPLGGSLLKFLIQAQHTSLLEHVSMSFALTGISRALLAQITRHRMGSFTSASQHYSDYRDMPMSVHSDLVDNHNMRTALIDSLDAYMIMVDDGVKPEEARMVLPNACCVNLIWSINARSLLNFMEQRCCDRNVKEMRVLTDRIYEAVKSYWPEYASHLGPYCFTHKGKCNQGKMSCGSPWTIKGEV